MENNDKETFSIQSRLLREAAELIIVRSTQIEEYERNKKYDNESDEEMNTAISLFKARSLKLLHSTLIFLSTEILRDEEYIYIFLIPNIRKIFDVFARFFYLTEEKIEQGALICISYQLLSYKNLDSDSMYKGTLKLYENFLKKINFSFPELLKDFDYNWIKDNGLSFPKMNKMMKSENIKKYSVVSFDFFSAKEPYKLYTSFSEMIHGNPYYYTDKPVNERLWIIATSTYMISYFIEMIDQTIFKKTKKKDFMDWIKDVQKNKKNFLQLWKIKREQLIKNSK